jgi:hypothetical protein
LIWLYWFWAGALLLLILTLVLGEGPVLVGGRSITRAQAGSLVLPTLAPLALAVAGAALALGLARPWARVAALFPFVLAVFTPVLMTGSAGADPSMLLPVPILVLLAWYLYTRPGPRAYFARPVPDPQPSEGESRASGVGNE